MSCKSAEFRRRRTSVGADTRVVIRGKSAVQQSNLCPRKASLTGNRKALNRRRFRAFAEWAVQTRICNWHIRSVAKLQHHIALTRQKPHPTATIVSAGGHMRDLQYLQMSTRPGRTHFVYTVGFPRNSQGFRFDLLRFSHASPYSTPNFKVPSVSKCSLPCGR